MKFQQGDVFMNRHRSLYWNSKLGQLIAKVGFLLLLSIAHAASAIDLAQSPLFVGQSVKPVVMLAMSRDQELSYKAYPDYSNLDGGFLRSADLTYRNDFKYYGYFDSNWCYDYVADTTATANSFFAPSVKATNNKCSGKWSGNFLNWASMTRMDILRKVLFGGKRAVDTAASTSASGDTVPASTILERSFLPKESHAFAKVYAGADGAVSDYTPYANSEVTICNVSTESGAAGYPVIRVAPGTWYNWSHTEEQQCQWRTDTTNTTNLPAEDTTSPTLTSRLGEFVVKVKVCDPTKDAPDNAYNVSTNTKGGCIAYETGSYKPVGVLQKKYDSINFGLVTGSWGAPGKGGVLRKKAGPIAGISYSTDDDTVNEFSTETGVFNSGVQGIIHNLSLFRIAQYSYKPDNGTIRYSGNLDWRNPIGEIYAETLRYLAGAKSALFDANEITETAALPLTRVGSSIWGDPLPSNSWCASCSIIVLSSGPNSFDGNDLTSDYLKTINATLTRSVLDGYTDGIGTNEFGAETNKFFLGLSANANLSTQCSVKDLKLSGLLGTCPEFPTGQGTYAIAGLSRYARINDIRSSYSGKQTVSTYAVELSEGLPNFNIPVGDKFVSIIPVCTNGTHVNACSLVGVRVENIANDENGKPISGSYLFYWEDNQWGSDYDMDAVQRLEFCVGAACGTGVNSNQIKIVNTLPYWATGTSRMHMSYNLVGLDLSVTGQAEGTQTLQWVTRGGYDPHNLGYVSSIRSLSWYNTIPPEGTDDLPPDTADNSYRKEKVYTAGGADVPSLRNLKSSLFYAAKYGKFDDTNNNGIPDSQSEWDVQNVRGEPVPDGLPDNYFVMKNPSLLEESLINIFASISKETATGSGVATNSTRLEEGTFVYQAMFNTKGWFGEIKAFTQSNNAAQGFVEVWSTKGKINSEASRKVFTYNPESRKSFEFNTANWSMLSTTQKAALGANATSAQQLMNWVRGSDISGYRKRLMSDGTKNLLGDVVTSTPVFAGDANEGHDRLEDSVYGGSEYKAYLAGAKSSRTKVLYANANDGMLHAINADCTKTNIGDCGKELFTYIPSPVYSKFATIASPSYGESIAHQYLVDGPIALGDAYINVPGQTGRQWRNILVGSMGAGARGIFVLDVTDPDNFDEDNVLFEITATDMPQIGNVFGRPYIAPVNGRWKVVLGNGYNSADGRAYLLVIDLESPFDPIYTKAVVTNTETANGLAGPALYRAVNTGPIEVAYAGDRLGNMWKFNLTGSASSWVPAFSGGSNYLPLFFASVGGVGQPITASPTLGFKNGNSVGGDDAIMVYFGTGSYMTLNDVETTATQSFYGIADSDEPISYKANRSSVLHEKEMTTSGKVRDVDDSGTRASTPDWRNDEGWYLDFPVSERVLSKAVLAYDRVIFSTMIPNTDGCSFGGTGWLMELVGTGDSSIMGTERSLRSHNGSFLDVFIPGEIARLKNSLAGVSGTDTLIYGTADGQLIAESIDGGGASDALGRLSWRQLE